MYSFATSRRRPNLEALEARDVPSASGERFAAAIFPDLLGRLADPNAFAYASARFDQGASRAEFVSEITNAPEYRTRLVREAFERIVGRAADAGSEEYFRNVLSAGGTPEQMRAELAASDEYFGRFGEGTNAEFVRSLFLDALHREATEGDVAYYTAALDAGLSRRQAATEVFGSGEGRRARVRELYGDFLGRSADEGGLVFHATRLGETGEGAVIAGLMGSPEYYRTRVDERGTPEESFVSQLYEDQLNRPLDSGGRAFWLDAFGRGFTRLAVASGIVNSDERERAEVQDWFEKYLQRAADGGTVDYFQSRRRQFRSAAQLQAEILASNEYYSNRGGGTDAGFLAALYKDVLGRAIDAGGREFFLSALDSGDLSRTGVATRVFASDEYRTKLVTDLFRQALRREPDAGGLEFYRELARRGIGPAALLTTILNSPEYTDLIENNQAVNFSGQAQGKFTSPSPAANATGDGSAFLQWGKAESGSTRSTFRFAGESINTTPGREFPLGTLEYHNGVNTLGTEITSVGLTLQVNLAGQSAPVPVIVPLTVSTTVNNQLDPDADADTLSFPGEARSQTFTTPDGRAYTLQLTAFRSAKGENTPALNELVVREDETKSAQLWATVTPTPGAEPAVSISVRRNIVTLMENATFDIQVTGANVPIQSYGVRLERFLNSRDNNYFEKKGQGTQVTVNARLAGEFRYRGFAVDANGREYLSPFSNANKLQVIFPRLTVAQKAPGFAGANTAMEAAFREAEQFSVGNPKSVRETGLTILLDTRTGLYRAADKQFGPPFPVDKLGEDPKDRPSVRPEVGERVLQGLAPVQSFEKGEEYIFAIFHTHTPSKFRSIHKGIGPSKEDVAFTRFFRVGGYVMDYVAKMTIDGKGAIPPKHPLSTLSGESSAYFLYWDGNETTEIRLLK